MTGGLSLVDSSVELAVVLVVIDSLLEILTEGGDLFLEFSDDVVQSVEFVGSSVSLLVEEFTGSFESGFLILDILFSFVGESEGFSFLHESNININFKLFNVSFSLSFVDGESGEFLLGLDDELSGVEGSGDLVLLEESDTGGEGSLKSVEHGGDLLVEGLAFEVGSVDGGVEGVVGEDTSVVVNLTTSGSAVVTGFGLVKVTEVTTGVGLGDGDVRDLFASLEELFHGVGLEEVLVLGEFARETFLLDFSEDGGALTSGLRSEELSSDDLDGVKSVLMFLELLDEELVGLASGDVELIKFGSDGLDSVVDPFEVGVGVGHFGLEPFSSLDLLLVDGDIGVPDAGELGNGSLEVDLLLVPTFLMVNLFLLDGVSEFEEKSLNLVDGVGSSLIGFHHLGDLGVEGRCVRSGEDKGNNKDAGSSHCYDICFLILKNWCFLKILGNMTVS